MSDSCSCVKKESGVNELKSLFSEDKCHQKLCVRRVGGLLGMVAVVTAIFLKIDHDCLQPLLFVSSALLGLTTADKFLK